MIKEQQSKTELYLYVQWRTDYMFRPFPKWPLSGWNTMSEELYTYYTYRHCIPTWWRPIKKRPKHVVGTSLYIQI